MYHEWVSRETGRIISCWSLKVKSVDMGGQQVEELVFNKLALARQVDIGYRFQH